MVTSATNARIKLSKNTDPDPNFLKMLVCPLTKGPLRHDVKTNELISDDAGLAFPIRNGIPIMLKDEARCLNSDD